MSPEQAKGRQADKRSDVWAFGAVLYEMLSGQRAFKGDDISDTLAAVLRQDIDWTALPASTPASVRRLIARCLDRDARKRLRDIGEARIVLDDPTALARSDAEDVPALAPPQPLWRRGIPVVLSAIVAGVLASAATVYFIPSQAPLVVTRFPLTLGEGQRFSEPAQGASRQFVALSPDGAQVAYLANGRLYLRSMSELEARPIAGADSGFVSSPVFSPDSRSVAFWSSADRTLKRVAVGGGAPSTICRLQDQPVGMSWGADDGIVFGQADGIMRVSAKGGTPDVLVSLKDGEQVYGPEMLPGGETVLFTVASGATGERWDKARIVTQSLRSGERKTLVDGGSDGRYVPTGHLVYSMSGIVFAVPMDVRGLEVTGEPVQIVEGVRRSRNHRREPVRFFDHGIADLRPGTGVARSGPVGSGAHRPEGRRGAAETLAGTLPTSSRLSERRPDRRCYRRWQGGGDLDSPAGQHDVNAAAHIRRQEPFSDLVGGRPARGLPVGSRRRPRHLLAAGGRLRRGGAVDETR